MKTAHVAPVARLRQRARDRRRMFNVGAISTKAMKYEKFWPIVMSHQTNFNKLALFPIHLALPTR
jgi:hypothetical protein